MAGYSWPDMRIRWCTHELKDKPREKFFRDLRKKYNIIEYVGIAADEKRCYNKNVRSVTKRWWVKAGAVAGSGFSFLCH